MRNEKEAEEYPLYDQEAVENESMLVFLSICAQSLHGFWKRHIGIVIFSLLIITIFIGRCTHVGLE